MDAARFVLRYELARACDSRRRRRNCAATASNPVPRSVTEAGSGTTAGANSTDVTVPETWPKAPRGLESANAKRQERVSNSARLKLEGRASDENTVSCASRNSIRN